MRTSGRLVRLIPKEKDNHSDIEARAIKSLFSHRLPPSCRAAREEWLDIVESTHVLWQNISTPKKELIRSFFNVINLEIVKRLRPSSRFDFTNASVGNLFLTGRVCYTAPIACQLLTRIVLDSSRDLSSRPYICCRAFAQSLRMCRYFRRSTPILQTTSRWVWKMAKSLPARTTLAIQARALL